MEMERSDGVPNPFGDEPRPWYKGREPAAPKSQTYPVGVVSALLSGVATQASGLHGVARYLVFLALAALPSTLLERWWRRRERRTEESLWTSA